MSGSIQVVRRNSGKDLYDERIAMTELLYQTDSYLREFEATMTEVGELGLALDRTAFYPGGGGQAPDKGVLLWDGVEHPVVALKKQGDTVSG